MSKHLRGENQSEKIKKGTSWKRKYHLQKTPHPRFKNNAKTDSAFGCFTTCPMQQQ